MQPNFEALVSSAERLGCQVYRLSPPSSGLGVVFHDGADVFWCQPEEHWATLHAAIEREEAGACFERINRSRSRVAQAAVGYLRANGCEVSQSANGEWGISKSGSQSSISLGPSLTLALAQAGKNAQAGKDSGEQEVACLVRIFEWALGFAPKLSVEAASKLLIQLEVPELPTQTHQPLPQIDQSVNEDEDESPYSPEQALRWITVCRSIDSLADQKNVDEWRAAAEPRGRIMQALQVMAEQLPDENAAIELGSGSMVIDFRDGYAAMNVRPTSQELRDLIRKRGVQQAGEALAALFHELNSNRVNVLKSVFGELREHGYHADKREPEHVGRAHREFRIETGDSLTEKIEESGAEAAVRWMLAPCPRLISGAIRRLSDIGDFIELPSTDLKPLLATPSPAPALDDEDYRRAHACAVVLAKTFVLAKTLPSESKQHVPDEKDQSNEFLKRLSEETPHHEHSEAMIAWLWQRRSEFPELARKWFEPIADWGVPYAEVRAPLGDPVAAHVMIAEILDEDGDDHFEVLPRDLLEVDLNWILIFVAAEQLDCWHQRARDWARNLWDFRCGGDCHVLEIADRLGWSDVIDLFRENQQVQFICNHPTGIMNLPEDWFDSACADDCLRAISTFVPAEVARDVVARSLIEGVEGELRRVSRRDIAEIDDRQLRETIEASIRRGLCRALVSAWDRVKLPAGQK